MNHPSRVKNGVAGLRMEACQAVRQRTVCKRLPQDFRGGARLQAGINAAFYSRFQHDPGFGLCGPRIGRMHLHREHFTYVEELEQQREAAETSSEFSHYPFWKLLQHLTDGLPLEPSIADTAGMIFAVAQYPRFTDWAVPWQWRFQQAGETPSAPQPILVDRFELQRVERCLAHDPPFATGDAAATPSLRSVCRSLSRQASVSGPPKRARHDACVASKPAKPLAGQLVRLPAAHFQEQCAAFYDAPALRFRADRSSFRSLPRRLPFPVTNLRQVFAVLIDVMLVHDEFVLHHLLQVGAF